MNQSLRDITHYMSLACSLAIVDVFRRRDVLCCVALRDDWRQPALRSESCSQGQRDKYGQSEQWQCLLFIACSVATLSSFLLIPALKFSVLQVSQSPSFASSFVSPAIHLAPPAFLPSRTLPLIQPCPSNCAEVVYVLEKQAAVVFSTYERKKARNCKTTWYL
jgi:hypothetical protein